MATILYFQEKIPSVGDNCKVDQQTEGNVVEICVSSFSGKHELYLKCIDKDKNEIISILNKKQANAFLEGLESAMSYLAYAE